LAQAASDSQPKAATPAGDDEKNKADKAGVPATVVDGEQLESVLGIEAFSSTGENMGRIVDIIVDRSGQIRAAIIDFGGFLGVGSRKIAVGWLRRRESDEGSIAGRASLQGGRAGRHDRRSRREALKKLHSIARFNGNALFRITTTLQRTHVRFLRSRPAEKGSLPQGRREVARAPVA
jgi:hypothetical protein